MGDAGVENAAPHQWSLRRRVFTLTAAELSAVAWIKQKKKLHQNPLLKAVNVTIKRIYSEVRSAVLYLDQIQFSLTLI